MKTIVIGNAPSVLLNEYGNKIDSFDRVIRMNDYEISGYEKYVGTKTNCYFRSHNPEYKRRTASDFDRVWLKSGWERWKREFDITPFNDMDSPNIEIISGSAWNRKGVKKTKQKTTGIRAIEIAIENFYSKGNPIYIYGFTFFNQAGAKASSCRRPHYYLNEPPNMYFTFTTKTVRDYYEHEFHIEREYVKELINNGKVKPLFPNEISGDIDLSALQDCREYIPSFLANKPRPGKRFKGQKYGPEGYVKK